MPERILIEIYSRPGCHLCDDAKGVVEAVRSVYPPDRPLDLRVIDIERDPELEELYGAEIPVIFLNGQEAFRHRIDAAELERKLTQLWNQ